MNFESFTQTLPELRKSNPKAIDLTETRVLRGFSSLVADLHRGLEVPEVGYRCHISEAWAARLHGLAVRPGQILISQGVRHALTVLFKGWAEDGLVAALPGDVYPVYLRLAGDAGLRYITYPTQQGCDFSKVQDCHVILTTNPLKPRGDRLAEQEVLALQQWLRVDSQRRVVVDAVYDLEPSLVPGTRTLFETGQTLVLHSLSKAWLSPLCAGAVVMPQTELERWTPVFREQPVDRSSLAKAYALLSARPAFPQALMVEMAQREVALRDLLAARDLSVVPPVGAMVPSYLFMVKGSFQSVLERDVIGLPATVFGSNVEDFTVVSSLSLG